MGADGRRFVGAGKPFMLALPMGGGEPAVEPPLACDAKCPKRYIPVPRVAYGGKDWFTTFYLFLGSGLVFANFRVFRRYT